MFENNYSKFFDEKNIENESVEELKENEEIKMKNLLYLLFGVKMIYHVLYIHILWIQILFFFEVGAFIDVSINLTIFG